MGRKKGKQSSGFYSKAARGEKAQKNNSAHLLAEQTRGAQERLRTLAQQDGSFFRRCKSQSGSFEQRYLQALQFNACETTEIQFTTGSQLASRQNNKSGVVGRQQPSSFHPSSRTPLCSTQVKKQRRKN